MVDTDRDGFDIDCCRNVRIANRAVNTPNDDAICLKSSYALGKPRFTEHVTISGCQVSGFDLGTLLDGIFGKTQLETPDKEGVCGRIKLGTESNGGFRNIAIANCVFEHCRGLAIESVDGALIADVTVDNLAMRALTNAPLFIRLRRRMRAPEGTGVGAIRRVNISNVVVSQANAPFAPIARRARHRHPRRARGGGPGAPEIIARHWSPPAISPYSSDNKNNGGDRPCRAAACC